MTGRNEDARAAEGHRNKILAKRCPPGRLPDNEFPNHLIVLDAYGRR